MGFGAQVNILTEKDVFWGNTGKSPYCSATGSLGEGNMPETKLLFGKKNMGFTFLTWEK